MDEDVLVPAPTKRDARWVFWGPEGIRAGWGALLFAVLYIAFLVLTEWMLRPYLAGVRHITVLPLRLALILEVAQFLPAIAATILMALVERKSPLAYGFKGDTPAIRFFSGLICGFAALSALVLVLWKARLLAFDGKALHGGAIWGYALGWGFMFLMVAVFEESTLRGYLQFALTRGIGFWWGAILLSLVFAFSHGTNPGETKVGVYGIIATGLMLCLSLWYTGSLWWAVGCHAGWDWAQTYFYGTSDSGMVAQGHLFSAHPIGSLLWSGGTTGPEGSPLATGMVAIMALLMWLWWGRRVKSPFSDCAWRPAWSRKPTDYK